MGIVFLGMSLSFWLMIAAIIFIFWFIASHSPAVHVAHWHHSFDNFDYPPKDFYALARTAIRKRDIPEIAFSTIVHVEEGILGNRREYLRLARRNYHLDICAAPFGSGFYVSWYLIERRSIFKEMLRKWEFLASIMDMKTYYQMDTEMMFKEFVHASLMEAIDQMTTTKGLRALSDTERQFADSTRKSLLT